MKTPATQKHELVFKHVLQYLFNGFRSDFELKLLLLTRSEASGDLFKRSIVNAHYQVTIYRVTSRTRQERKTLVLNVILGNLVRRKHPGNRTTQQEH